MNVLLNEYIKSPRLFVLADLLSFSSPQKVFLKNLNGSSPQFIVSSIFAHPSCSLINHLVVANDAEEAAYFHNTLENITNALDLFYFPFSYKNRKNFSLLNSSHLMLRTEALMKISIGGNKKIIVTYPEALAEKVVFQRNLAETMIQIKAGDTLEVNLLIEKLVSYHFERTDFVYEPGQFALRGGILDIYSFGNEKPYRVELFGNDVESIRIFDAETQLSERKLLHVTIIPNVETQFDKSEKVSLLEFLPQNTCIWLQDWDLVKEKIVTQEEELQVFLKQQENNSNSQKIDEEKFERTGVDENDFVKAPILEEFIQQRHIIEFGYKSYFTDKTPHSVSGQLLSANEPKGNGQLASALDKGVSMIEFHTKPQPAFNRQFDLLIKDLKSWEAKKYNIFLFADNPKQLERLHSIFADLKADIPFTPIPTSIHEGFRDDDLKIVCYTDHQIFQRYHKYKVKQAYNKNKAITLRTLRDLEPGDYVTHFDHGLGIYSGLQKIEANGRLQEAVRIIYKDNDILYVNINSLHKISKYTGKEGSVPKINKIGSDTWQKLKEKTKTRVKEIAFDLIKLYASRKAQHGFAHSPDNYMQTELEASFVYEDTPDQSRATADVKKDMEASSPMDRLICGDVGFGKTEVAIRAAFKSCCDGKQAAILVPTTILAFQHYKTLSDRLKDFPVTIDYINRFKSSKEKKKP